jgi:Tfp pilus assembly protein PilV
MKTDWSRNHQKKTGQEGFAILEALIATAIFAIGIFGVLSMQTTAVKTNDIARGVTSQSAMAAEMVEQLLSVPYDHQNLTAGSHPPQKEGRYTISWAVTDDDMIVNTKTITVTVTWLERGAPKTINLTYIKPDTI